MDVSSVVGFILGDAFTAISTVAAAVLLVAVMLRVWRYLGDVMGAPVSGDSYPDFSDLYERLPDEPVDAWEAEQERRALEAYYADKTGEPAPEYEEDFFDGYSYEDDVRDRAAAGLPPQSREEYDKAFTESAAFDAQFDRFDDDGLESSSPGVDEAVEQQMSEVEADDWRDWRAMHGVDEPEYADGECPGCGGHGSYPTTDDDGNEIEVQCKPCNGTGLRNG